MTDDKKKFHVERVRGEKADLCEDTEKLNWPYDINEENHKPAS